MVKLQKRGLTMLFSCILLPVYSADRCGGSHQDRRPHCPLHPAISVHDARRAHFRPAPRNDLRGRLQRIKEVRVTGGCTCLEVYGPKTLEGFQQYAYERGMFSRPVLSYMYSMVPYVIEENELGQIFTVMEDWFRRG